MPRFVINVRAVAARRINFVYLEISITDIKNIMNLFSFFQFSKVKIVPFSEYDEARQRQSRSL